MFGSRSKGFGGEDDRVQQSRSRASRVDRLTEPSVFMAGGGEDRASKETTHGDGASAAGLSLLLLPDDVLEAVLRRLAPCSLAACRCACKAWRAVVDAGRLLRADLLPLKLGGVFINFVGHDLPRFLARPSTGPTISGCLELGDYMPRIDGSPILEDHCNGLLLLDDRVVNPATRKWMPLPSIYTPMEMVYDYQVRYLVYDPIVSPHYEVFMIPCFFKDDGLGFHPDYYMNKLDHKVEQSQWPPSSCIFHVFSSSTGQWEERSFAREGEAAGTIADMRLSFPPRRLHNYAAYWRGSLYVHYQTNFVMRITLSNNKYRLIKSPTDMSEYCDVYLGKSRKGVYIASLDANYRLQIWRLQELCGQMKWMLVHHTDLKRMVPRQNFYRQIHGTWRIQDVNYYNNEKLLCPDRNREGITNQKFEWNSDDDNIIENEDNLGYSSHFSILGFHPFKEVIFLCASLSGALAYHLDDSKVQDLGNLLAPESVAWATVSSFPYTPCWI